MFSIFARLEDGEFIFVASRDQLDQAIQIVQALNVNCPRNYIVCDSEDTTIDPNKYAAIFPNSTPLDLS